MTPTPLRLGIVGANAERGWASRTHLPAVQALATVELVAVATTRAESASAAAERFGARHAFSDPFELIRHPDVEAVTVAVKVPDHARLVQAALEAGKHVYCEWPLGTSTAEAVALRDLADSRGVRTAIGLQSRRSAQVQHARQLLADGAIGRVVSATLRSAAGIGGPTTTAAGAWLADADNGTNALTVTGGHALDTLAALIGDIGELSATVATRFPEATVKETGARVAVTSPDQVVLGGVTGDGVVVAAHVQGATGLRPGLTIEVRGTTGLLELVATPSLSAGRIEVRTVAPDGTTTELDLLATPPEAAGTAAALGDGAVANVGRVYADFAAAIRGEQAEVPDFGRAVRMHRLLDAIRTSAADGRHVATESAGAETPAVAG
jgi:predicted dehydrogenase